jgi:hypothetical protein
MKCHMMLYDMHQVEVSNNLMVFVKQREVGNGGFNNWADFIDFEDDDMSEPTKFTSLNMKIFGNVG